MVTREPPVSRVLCGNEAHARPTPAIATLEWPDGRFKPGTACWGCLKTLLRLYVLPGPHLTEDPHPVTVTPVDGDRLAPCGTRAAYIRHRKRGEEPCDPCKDANNADSRERLAGDCPHCGRSFRHLRTHLLRCPARGHSAKNPGGDDHAGH